MNKVFYIFVLVLLVSCTSNTIYKKPKNLIPKDTMISLLSDMFIASSAKSFKNKQLKMQVNYMPLVYIKYKIDSTRFTISNVYYTSKIERYEEILKEVEFKLKKHQEVYVDKKWLEDLDPTNPKKQEELEFQEEIPEFR